MKNTVIFLGGANKSGTTSLFKYLGYHPDVAQSLVKQPGFFLNEGVENQVNLVGFEKLFQADDIKNGKVLLEGTPDYLFDNRSAGRIRSLLGEENVRFIFVLRDPIERCKSWFKYGKQSGMVPQDESFEQFLKVCLSDSIDKKSEAYSAVVTGFYSKYIDIFYKSFDAKHILLCDFNDLENEPQKLLKTISAWLGIDGSRYDSYTPGVQNASVRTKSDLVRRVYVRIRKYVISGMRSNSIVAKVLGPVVPFFKTLYKYLNTDSVEDLDIPNKLILDLQHKYAKDAQVMLNKYNFKASWL